MHPVESKLRSEILPNLVAVLRLRDQWYYKVYIFHIYAQDLLAAIAAVGISHPILNALGNKTPTGDVTSALGNFPPWAVGLVTLCVITWAYLKLFMVREEIEKKAILIKSCRRQFIAIELNITRALTDANPMPKLLEEYNKMQQIIDRNVQEGIVELLDLISDDKTDVKVNEKALKLTNKYRNTWVAVDSANSRTDN